MAFLTLSELARVFHISKSKVHALHKAGYLVNVSDDWNSVGQMKRYLQSGRPLAVAMIIELLREPRLIDDLGTYARQARAVLRGIGNPEPDGFPAAEWPHINGASINEPASLQRLADWAQATIPAAGCSYHWLAVRLMWNVPAEHSKASYSRLPRALINLRKMPRMTGWSNAADGITRFTRPAEIAAPGVKAVQFDL